MTSRTKKSGIISSVLLIVGVVLLVYDFIASSTDDSEMIAFGIGFLCLVSSFVFSLIGLIKPQKTEIGKTLCLPGLVIPSIFFLFVFCAVGANRNASDSENPSYDPDATSITIEKNNLSQKAISKKFTELTEITFHDCDMTKYDLSALGSKIEKINLEYCEKTSKLLVSKPCYICSLNIKGFYGLKSLDLKNFPNLTELWVWDTHLEHCELPSENKIKKFTLWGTRIKDYSSFKNLTKAEEMCFSQEDFDGIYDVTFIKKLPMLKKARFSANFYVTEDIPAVDDLQIDGKEGFVATNSIMRFKNLRRLYYNADYQKEFPAEIAYLDKLEELLFFFTQIKDMPTDFTAFKNLRYLMIFPYSKHWTFSTDLVFPKTLRTFSTTNDCSDPKFYELKYPNVKFGWQKDIEL